MSESFLHYLWQYQYFDKADLHSTSHEPLSIFAPGHPNTNAGPDFQNARVRINDLEWIGSVEIHIHSSAWYEHHHNQDAAYDNVILHVVWKNDKDIKRSDGTTIPTLELKDRVDQKLLLGYRKLVNSAEEIPCARKWEDVPAVVKLSMLDKALAGRLEVKAMEILQLLKQNQQDWEETAYQLLARNFGFKINAEPFFQLAQRLPYKMLKKHADQLLQVEAMLFGVSGFLEEKHPVDEYYDLLRREYKVLRQKYALSQDQLNKVQWRLLRLRPANFPSIRIAQLANLIRERSSLFSLFIDAESYAELRDQLQAKTSPYWQQHYRFGARAKQSLAALGTSSIDNIITNTVAPLLVAYGKMRDDQKMVDRALTLLQSTPAEANQITRQWATLGFKCNTAFDSQAMIQLYNNFCKKRRCLDCNIGAFMLKPIK